MAAPALRSSIVSNSGATSTEPTNRPCAASKLISPTSLSNTIGSKTSLTVPVMETMQCGMTSGPRRFTASAAARKMPSSRSVGSLNGSAQEKVSGRAEASSSVSTLRFSSSLSPA